MDIQFPNLHINIENLPKTFNLFGVDIAFYGRIIAFGMLAGIVIACYMAKITGQDYNQYIDFAIYAILFSVIGARLYYVAFSWDYYGKHPAEIINIRQGGACNIWRRYRGSNNLFDIYPSKKDFFLQSYRYSNLRINFGTNYWKMGKLL